MLMYVFVMFVMMNMVMSVHNFFVVRSVTMVVIATVTVFLGFLMSVI